MMKTEAENLAERFMGVNRAKFARDFDVPGKGAMIYQHITGMKPISIECAIAYARGFNCSIAEISPSVAERLAKIPAIFSEQTINAPTNITPLKPPPEPLIAELLGLAQRMSPDGLQRLIGAAAVLAEQFPRAKTNHAQ